MLLATDNRFGAMSGILLLGGAFAPIYPLVVEKIGQPLSVLPSGFLQRHLFLRDRGRTAGAMHAGLFRLAVGRERGHGAAAGGDRVVFVLLPLIGLEARLGAAGRGAS